MIKILSGLVAAAVTLTVAWLIDPLLALGAGYAFAIGAPTLVTGTKASADFETNREDIDFEMGISLLDPYQNPATSITMSLKRGTTETIQKSWWEDELVPFIDTVNDGTNMIATDTTMVVDHGDRFAAGDIIRHDLSGEIMLVTAVSTNDLTVVRDYGYVSGGATGYPTEVDATILDGAYVTIVGNAFESGHPFPAIRSTKAVEYKNWCQQQRTPIGMTEVAKETRVRGEDDWAYQLRKIGIQHSIKLELQNIWGKPTAGDGSMYATTNSAPSTAGGINYYIEQFAPSDNKLDQDELTLDEFLDWLEYVFKYGSQTKFMYCSPRFRTAVERWGIMKLNTTVRDSVLGMKVVRWQSTHGDLVLLTHKMLTRNESTDYFYNFIVDQEELEYLTFGNLGSTRVRSLEPYKATGETTVKSEYFTISTMKFGQAAKHARLRFKTFSTAA